MPYADVIVTPASDSALEIGGLAEFARILAEITKQTGSPAVAHVIAARTNYARKQWPSLTAICEQHDNLQFSGTSLPLYVDFSDSLSPKGYLFVSSILPATQQRICDKLLNTLKTY